LTDQHLTGLELVNSLGEHPHGITVGQTVFLQGAF
jgi:hypothetical protein